MLNALPECDRFLMPLGAIADEVEHRVRPHIREPTVHLPPPDGAPLRHGLVGEDGTAELNLPRVNLRLIPDREQPRQGRPDGAVVVRLHGVGGTLESTGNGCPVYV